MKTRNTVIAFMQTFGIILVVIGHSFYERMPNPVASWIYSFHMPLFFYISGFLFCSSCKRRNIPIDEIPLFGKDSIIVSKAQRLLVPYLFISTIAFYLKNLFSNLAVRPIDGTFDEYFLMLFFPYSNVICFYWFLPCLFLVFLFFVIIAKIVRPNINVLLFIIAIDLFVHISEDFFLNLDGVLFYMQFFVLGYVSSLHNWHKVIMEKCLPIAIVTIILSIIIFQVSAKVHLDNKNIISSVNGILMSVSLGCLYDKYKCKFFNHLFGASYMIYLYSWFVQTICFQFVYEIFHIPFKIVFCCAIISSIYIPLILHLWLNRGVMTRLKIIIAFVSGMKLIRHTK